jgi:hypothetical protein
MMRPLIEDWRLIFKSKGRVNSSGYDSSGFAITHESQASQTGKILVNRSATDSNSCYLVNNRFREYEIGMDDLRLQTIHSNFSKTCV